MRKFDEISIDSYFANFLKLLTKEVQGFYSVKSNISKRKLRTQYLARSQMIDYCITTEKAINGR